MPCYILYLCIISPLGVGKQILLIRRGRTHTVTEGGDVLDKPVYTVKEVAEVLGVTRNCVYSMISAGKIAPIIRIGRGDREMRVPGYVVNALLKGGSTDGSTDESPCVTD